MYLTTPPVERAETFFEAIEKTGSLAYFSDPLKAMEGVLGKTPGDLEEFLSPWITGLGRGGSPHFRRSFVRLWSRFGDEGRRRSFLAARVSRSVQCPDLRRASPACQQVLHTHPTRTLQM